MSLTLRSRMIAGILAASLGPFAAIAPAYAATGQELLDDRKYADAAAAFEGQASSDPDAYLGLGRSYIGLKRYREAIEALRNYREKAPKANKTWVDAVIAILDRNDDAVTFENIGVVNAPQDDYSPVISQDGKSLYFCGVDRPGGIKGEDIWVSQMGANGLWQAPTAMAVPMNTETHEAMESISGDGQLAIVFGNYKGTFGHGDLFYSVRDGDKWSPPCNLGGTINTDGWEAQANLGPDGRTLLWASKRAGGQGESDLWVSTLTEAGWTKPQNLGPTINTSGMEQSPFLSADGKTLYFASNTHPGLGKADMFVSKRTGDGWTGWSRPINLGKNINTDGDDTYLSIPASGTRGYITHNVPGGHGKDDIYSFVLPYDMRPEPVHRLQGVVQDEKGTPVAAILHYLDVDRGREVATATSNRSTGMYSVALPQKRRYRVTIDMKNFMYMSEDLDLRNPSKVKTSWRNTVARESGNMVKARTRMDVLGGELDQLIGDESPDVAGGFNHLQRISSDYVTAAQNLEIYTRRAKMAWLAKEGEVPAIRRDYSLQPIKLGAKLVLKNIFFDTGKATLRAESRQELDKLVELMERAAISIELGGHTDDVGDDGDNKKLSQARVEEVKKFLVGKGIIAKRMTAVGYGERKPVAPNSTEPGRQRNRRVELEITSIAQRGGQDVVKDEIKYDLATLIRHASIVGGLPADSPCRDEIGPRIANVPVIPGIKPIARPKTRALALADYVYDASNPFFSSRNPGGGNMWGGGMITLDDELNENHLAFHGSALVPSRWIASWATVRAWQLNGLAGVPLTALYGFEVDGGLAGISGTSSNAPMLSFNVPLGLRYVHPFGEFKVGPELIYSHGLYTLGPPINTGFTRIGCAVRWKSLNGAAFVDSGGWNSGLGLRAGLAY